MELQKILHSREGGKERKTEQNVSGANRKQSAR